MIDRNLMLGRSDEFGPILSEFGRTDGWEPTFVFRLGYSLREVPHSPRRQLTEVVKSEIAINGPESRFIPTHSESP
jgi:hypothetical protein